MCQLTILFNFICIMSQHLVNKIEYKQNFYFTNPFLKHKHFNFFYCIFSMCFTRLHTNCLCANSRSSLKSLVVLCRENGTKNKNVFFFSIFVTRISLHSVYSIAVRWRWWWRKEKKKIFNPIVNPVAIAGLSTRFY